MGLTALALSLVLCCCRHPLPSTLAVERLLCDVVVCSCVSIFSNSMFAGGAPVLKQLLQLFIPLRWFPYMSFGEGFGTVCSVRAASPTECPFALVCRA